jgi:molybdenum cofactor cytidylyltransferase
MSKPEASVAGIVLAAGAGTRFGGAKALARDTDGTAWLPRAVRALLAGGCSPVLVVLGSEGSAAEQLLSSTSLLADDSPVRVVHVENWSDGISASIRAGLAEAERLDPLPDAVAIVTVDVPSLSAAMVRRLLSDAGEAGEARAAEPSHALRQASFSGRPGHPVVVGRAHWSPLADALHGDVGARPYLVAHGVSIVDCSDLGSGLDVDRPGVVTG